MRTIWILILLGSLIIHHCFTTIAGEAVPKDAQPSYSDCKPYVDAALKGDIPADPGDITEEPNNDDHSDEEEDEPPGGGDSSESSEEEEDDINGLEVNSEEEVDSDAITTKSEIQTPPQIPPTVPTTKTTSTEEETSEENQSDEEHARDSTKTNKAPASTQHHRTGSHSVAKNPHDTTPPPVRPGDDDEDRQVKNEEKKPPIPPKETKTTVTPVEDTSEEEDASEEIIVKVASPKEKKPSKVEKFQEKPHKTAKIPESNTIKERESKPVQIQVEDDDDDSSEEDDEPKTLPENDNSEEEEPIKIKTKKLDEEPIKTTGTKLKKLPKIELVQDDDDDEPVKTETVKKQPKKEKLEIKSKSPKPSKVESDESDEDEIPPKKSTKSHTKPEVIQPDYEPRSRDNLIRILGLKSTSDLKQKNSLLDKVTQQTLKELKNTYEYAIKPLETLYKYRDLSNRHFGDPEIFSKPMVVFMGPWSGGKSTIINWLLGIEHDEHALRTGADPSPAQFNILTYGEDEEVLDGTQLAADWTFSGLQKFGQSFLDRLRGRKLPNRLLEKVNLVEIPGILEIRKQVERSFPFNDACQWFIDRADVLFLVYDPAKLDIGPETEAILDQLKGRESQVRIVLNKADSVKPDELLRVQATLIWNISPLMASAEPPALYVASLWDRPLKPEAPATLLNAHETLFLKDINDATLKRVETRIAAARRFAVRVRNHAKMVDCYLNTFNNHRSFFSNKKRISDDIIDHPQNYHIYEGLSTLTNISRYDLPDPDSYRDFFRLNSVWEFPTLASTCTYFRGCPINKLDVAIAYDLPELLGRYRRQRESILSAPSANLPGIKVPDAPTGKKEEPIDIPKGKARWYKLPPEDKDKSAEEVHPPKPSKKPSPSAILKKPEPPSPNPGKNKWWKEVPEAATPSKVEGAVPGKPKNKWWKEVPEVQKPDPEVVKGHKEKDKVKKKTEGVAPRKKLVPKEGFKIVQPTNKWYFEYYEPIKSKDHQSNQEQPKKNKWYTT